MDLSIYTKQELLDLRMKINSELEAYNDREKTKVYTVFIKFIGTAYFIKKENAIGYLKDCIEEGMLFDGNEAKCGEKYLNDAEVKSYCRDSI